ncbi:MAG: response regulator [Trichodesmium sp. St16_bin4-tuft]|uniref:Response regulator receiver protein n=1 Tax=Trichodesmium erythraeum (strain IMS101) TaxID=203124 RepID=Q10Z28_TRIEI|nr:response regulator [Trichodesmium erythraeum GBRTRLIN201]MCH2048129.1 response regulator [Trichodesmium sp. ALOHA_ZT_67]MDE5077091.1 response regulator [Trichodesmium sp. St2_bin6]MDE5097787.1 response regulator [Trichodesmium sp. St16_bin4-tuft]MDE5102303.1 response regulator [Trichodesmium sp. St19_bin2]MDT9341123.1 response regulator [Trichodesmium erythraeum 21-75]
MSEKLNLMVVDDEPNNLDLLYRTFRRQFKVFRAENARIAMEILETQGEMAVIISDQSMPDMTGIQFLIKTRESFPDTIRILLSGYEQEEINSVENDIQQADIFKCVTKPFSPQELKDVLQECLEIYKTKKSL